MANRNEEAHKRIISDREWLRKSRDDVPPSQRPKDKTLLQQLREQRERARDTSQPTNRDTE